MNIGVVPARLASKRLPKKILADLDGKPMVAHTMEQVLKAQKLDKVIFVNALTNYKFAFLIVTLKTLAFLFATSNEYVCLK